MIFTDKTLSCRVCDFVFLFPAAEQRRYATLGFGEPERCPQCRTQRDWVESASRILPRSRRGFDPAGGGRTYAAVCAVCGRETRLPFRPKGDRPVYCGDCFEKRRG